MPEPTDDEIRFEDYPAETIPPLRDRPPMAVSRELEDRRDVDVRRGRSGIGARTATRIVATVAEDPAIRRLLGRRFVPIGIRTPTTKDGRETVVSYYSYAHQWTVEARLDDAGTVIDAGTSRTQPPLTDAELAQSIRLAREAIQEDTRELAVGAIAVMREEPDDPLAGRRLADVRFFERDRRLPRYHATVDLGGRQVLEAGTVEGSDDHG